MTVLTGGAVELSKNFINDKPYKGKVISTLVYGVQWDTTLKFFNDENYLKSSIGKGHYSASSPIYTGTNENYKVKNIYDMAGNVTEWTMEAFYTSDRVFRGSSYGGDGNNYPSSFRDNYGPHHSNSAIGFRLALYF